mgnify:FL=1
MYNMTDMVEILVVPGFDVAAIETGYERLTVRALLDCIDNAKGKVAVNLSY